MGIAPYKYFTFDGASSRDYDVYITGEGVFNAPERDVEMFTIPGRNGSYALDHGKFNNITVTYKAGLVDASESNFADKMSAVRNWLCSKVGYKRLSDDYNPNEYRMAVFKSGVTVEHVDLKTGEFDITFDCKPQRWLTAGETATAVANNGTLSNPTLFDSEPLLAVKGYGTIGFNGYEIEINNEVMGDVIVAEADDVYRPTTWTTTIQADLLNTSDTFVVNAEFVIQHTKTSANQVTSITLGTATGCSAVYIPPHTVNVVMDSATFTKGTSATATCSIAYSAVTTNTGTKSCTQTCSVAYDGTSTLTFSMSGTNITNTANKRKARHGAIYGDSTVSVLGNPTYIDCDIGECYMIKNSEIISLNQYIDLGSDLPKLASGTNTFTYDNTVTELKVTPRWWKV